MLLRWATVDAAAPRPALGVGREARDTDVVCGPVDRDDMEGKNLMGGHSKIGGPARLTETIVPAPTRDAALAIARPADDLLVVGDAMKQSDTLAILDALAAREAELKAAERCPDCGCFCTGTLYDAPGDVRTMLSRTYSCKSRLDRDGRFVKSKRCERLEARLRR